VDDYFEKYKDRYNQNGLGNTLYAPISQDPEDSVVNFQSKFFLLKCPLRVEADFGCFGPRFGKGLSVTEDGKDLKEGENTENEEPKSTEINFNDNVPVPVDYNDIACIDMNERLVFLTIYRRLPPRDFMTLLKLFALYSNSIVSYVGKLLFSFWFLLLDVLTN
jgi:hypothetical protein